MMDESGPDPARARAIDDLPPVGEAAVCMGAFDGVHRGHVKLVETTRAAAHALGVASVALVFDPHPDEVIRPGLVVPRLAPLAVNLHGLRDAGIDWAVAVRFDAALRALEPEAFIAAMQPSIVLRALVMTPESAFGRGRAGTPDAMRAHGRVTGFELVLAEQELDGGAPVSSARVRAALAAGDVAEATRLLGHLPYLAGRLAPEGAYTELQPQYAAALPGPGRYAAELLADGLRHEAEVTVSAEGRVFVTPGTSGAGGRGSAIGVVLRERLGAA
jgi:FAD synthase